MPGDNIVWGEGISIVEAGTGDYKQMLSSQNEYYYEYAQVILLPVTILFLAMLVVGTVIMKNILPVNIVI